MDDWNEAGRGKKIDFVIEAEEELPKYLTGDVLHTKQVILNLISNAVKYTEEGRVTLEINASGDQIIFSVKIQESGFEKRIWTHYLICLHVWI